jgi:hypothetical protein
VSTITITPASSTTFNGNTSNEVLRDRAYWRREAARVGSDWAGVLATHAEAVTAWRTRYDPDYRGEASLPCSACGAAPCTNPSFCAVCREADRRRHAPPHDR